MAPKKTAKVTGSVCAVSAIIAIVLSMDTGLRINQEGLELIGNAESCRRDPYMCPARVLTVGIGSTGKVENRRYSDAEIAEMWVADIKTAEECVNQHANGKRMGDNQFSAVVSLTFNIGCGNLRTSTLARYAMRERWDEVCNQLPRWDKAGGKSLPGLTARRAKERVLCLTATTN